MDRRDLEPRGWVLHGNGWLHPLLRKIFVNSMSDLFHERVSDTLIMD